MITKYFSKQFAAISTSVVLLTTSYSALAEIMTLTFDVTNIEHHQRNFVSNTGVLMKDLPDREVTIVEPQTLTVQLDTSFSSKARSNLDIGAGWKFINNEWQYISLPGAGEKTEVMTHITINDMTSSLNVESAFRNINPNYGNNTLSDKNAYAEQSYFDFTDASGYIDAGTKYINFLEHLRSYSYESLTETAKTFTFYENLYLNVFNNFQSSTDPKPYTLNSLLKDIYLTSGRYELSKHDEVYTETNEGRVFSKSVGEWYYGEVNLSSINGIDADEYFSQIPTPTSISVLALALLALRVTRSKH